MYSLVSTMKELWKRLVAPCVEPPWRCVQRNTPWTGTGRGVYRRLNHQNVYRHRGVWKGC